MSSGGDLSPVNTIPDVFLTIINVVQVLLRIIWIIDDQNSTQAITVLGLEVTVIPVCALKKQGREPADTSRHEQGEIPFGPGPISHIKSFRLV